MSIAAVAVLPLLGGGCGSLPSAAVASDEAGRPGQVERGRAASLPPRARDAPACTGEPDGASLH